MELEVDHISFPVYNNLAFLDEVEGSWREHGSGRVQMGPQGPQYTGVFYLTKNFYVEHLSTAKNDGYWSNTIYVVVDKKHWDHYENPDSRNENWLKPRMHGGFAVFGPDSLPVQWSRQQPTIPYAGLKLMISSALEDQLKNVCGLKWELPPYLEVDERFLHPYDMAVINEDRRLIAPLHQCNFAGWYT